jgi:hypothetical protein
LKDNKCTGITTTKNKYGHKQEEEEAKIKWDILLKQAHKLFCLKIQISSKYHSKFTLSGNA